MLIKGKMAATVCFIFPEMRRPCLVWYGERERERNITCCSLSTKLGYALCVFVLVCVGLGTFVWVCVRACGTVCVRVGLCACMCVSLGLYVCAGMSAFMRVRAVAYYEK